MKKISFFIFIALLAFACSSDDSENEQATIAEILVQGSPWEPNRVEILEITDEDNVASFTPSEIEELASIIEDLNYSTFVFNSDSTGVWDSEGFCPDCDMIWNEIEGESQFRWAPRNWFNIYDVHLDGETVEFSSTLLQEDGYAIRKPDGTLIRGERLHYIYYWQ